MRARLMAVGLVAALLAACGSPGQRTRTVEEPVSLEVVSGSTPSAPLPSEPSPAPASTTTTPATSAPAGRPIGDVPRAELPSLVAAALDEYWTVAFAEDLGQVYEPLSGGLRPYRPSVDPPPTCGTTPVAAGAAEGNAFYCSADDAVTWDDEQLITDLQAISGPVGVALVFAHEWGHAVQRRVGGPPRGPVRELQADCFGGAFTAWATAGRSTILAVTPAQVDGAMAGYLTVRDGGMPAAGATGTHGTAFDRIRAFGTGYDRGVRACVAYGEEPPALAEPGRVVSEDALELSPAQTVDLVTVDLETYWAAAVAADTGTGGPVARAQVPVGAGAAAPACPGRPAGGVAGAGPAGVVACPATATVSWDLDGFLAPLGAQVGDFGVALALATAWSELVAARRTPFARSARAMADCLSGSWTADASRQQTPTFLQLQPGDLDEAMAGMLAMRPVDRPGEVTAFGRAHAFQVGFDGGRQACVTFG